MSERGFTLIEMLVALVAASLLLVPLGWLVGQLGTRLQDARAGQISNVLTEDRPVLDSLLRKARFVDNQSRTLDQSDTALKFIAPLPQAAGSRELTIWSLENISDAIILRSDKTSLPTVRLFEGYQIMEVNFTGRADYPDMVGLKLRDDNGQDYKINFRPLISDNPQCDFDLVTRKCR